jgi:hypothetical protein
VRRLRANGVQRRARAQLVDERERGSGGIGAELLRDPGSEALEHRDRTGTVADAIEQRDIASHHPFLIRRELRRPVRRLGRPNQIA